LIESYSIMIRWRTEFIKEIMQSLHKKKERKNLHADAHYFKKSNY